MRRSLPCLLSLALLATACGDESSPATTDDPNFKADEYFGVVEGRCLEYSSGIVGEDSTTLSIRIFKEEADLFGGATTWRFAFKMGSTPVMTEWVGTSGKELKLYRRRYFGAGARMATYDPPLTLARAPLKSGDFFASESTADLRDSIDNAVVLGTPATTLEILVAKQEAELPIGALPELYKHIYTETPARGTITSDSRTLIPAPKEGTGPAGWGIISEDLGPTGNGPISAHKLRTIYDFSDNPTAVEDCGLN